MLTVFTLGDLWRRGDAAARAGTPMAPRWVQCRAALLLLRHVCGDLDQIQIGDFPKTFPDDFASLEPALAHRFPSAHSYRTVRREIPPLLSLLGVGIDDGWDSVRTLARVHHSKRAFRTLVYLATPARDAGLKPSDVTPSWAFARDAQLRGSRRWSFRGSLKALDALFDVPQVAASGLLPATRIGRPPVYEKGDGVRDPLPPRLAAFCSALKSSTERGFVHWLWKALRQADCLGLPLDPSAEDLLAPAMMVRIEALRADGIKNNTFGTYRTGAVRVLQAHTTRSFDTRRRFRNACGSEGLPAQLSGICSQAANAGERAGLRGLWKAIRRAGGLGLSADPSADDLLTPSVWARIAALPSEDSGFMSGTLGTYRRAARRLLLHHAMCSGGPTRVTYPPHLAQILAEVRRKGERTGVQAVWLAILYMELAVTEDPSADELLATVVWGQIARLPPASLGLAPSTWKTYLAAAATALRRNSSGRLRGRAVKPAERTANGQALRSDRRRRGNMSLPTILAAELDALLDLMGYADNSRRALRSMLTRQFTLAHQTGGTTAPSTLRDLLAIDDQSLPENRMEPRHEAASEGLRAAMQLAAAPAWRELQSAVVASGVPPVSNPVPTLYEAAGRIFAAPKDMTREWAWSHERGLRPDLRITFSAHIDRLDALRALPTLMAGGLLPPDRLGPMPPRGGRLVHAVYPLPRPIEAAIAEFDLPDAERRNIEAAVHFFWRHARDAGLYAAGEAPTAEELLSETMIDRLRAMATGRAQRAAWREHMPRLRALAPVEAKVTPRSRWESLFAAARAHGLSHAALVPIYVVKSAALATNLGPEALSQAWAVTAVAAAPRADGNALNRGLRILDALRATMPLELLPSAQVSDGRPVKLT